MEKSVQITLIIAATAIVLAVLGWLAMSMVNVSANKVDVTGIAEVKTLPDIIAVYLSVETNATTATEAKDKNAEISDAVITSLINLGLARTDITTQNYNIYEDFVYTESGKQSLGFKATNQLKVELTSDKQSIAGNVIDAGVNAGATVSYINFELSQAKQNEYKAQALTLATQDAKTKADAIASGLGKKTGKVLSVSASDFSYRPWPLFAESAGGATDAKQAVTDIQPGEQTVSASVSVTYQLI